MAGASGNQRDMIAPAQVGATLLAFADAEGVPRRWRLITGGAIVGRGDEVAELPEQRDWVRVVLAVPGSQVTMQWLELDQMLTPAQAAAAARLELADASADPIGDLHFAAGGTEDGRTAIAMAPAHRMQAWLDKARALALEPDVVIPAPMLLLPPSDGVIRYPGDPTSDYRGQALAFSAEEELARLIVGDSPLRDLDENARDATLGPVLAQPPINLRQGAFARRREFVVDRIRIRWLIVLGLTLLLVSLLIQIVAILRTTAAADRYEQEAKALRQAIGTPGARPGASRARFGSSAVALFEAVRQTPNVQANQIVFLGDGSLRASIVADNQTSIDALRARIEALGMQASGGLPTNLGGRAAGEITIRPR